MQTVPFPLPRVARRSISLMPAGKKKTPGRVWSARLRGPIEQRLIEWAQDYGLVSESNEFEPTTVLRTFLAVHLARPGKPQETRREDAA